MSKQIKDYLHLYLGCECKTEEGKVGWFSGFDVCERDYSITMITVRFPGQSEEWTVLNDNEECDRIKLILRPLSDITNEDYKAIGGHGFGGSSTKELWLDQFEQFEERPAFGQGKKNEVDKPQMVKNKVREGLQLKHYTFSPEAFRYLLSKGFDLFGLIDAGLALDKTKQP